MRSIPIGIQDFKEVRDGGYYYVDKSRLIGQVLDSGAKVLLFTRPRRFGKSLNLSMLDAFFNSDYRWNSWFEGLSISERSDLESRRNACPVICVDFKDLNAGDFEMFVLGIRNKVAALYDKNRDAIDDRTSPMMKAEFDSVYGKTSDVDTLSRSLQTMTRLMSDHYGRKVVVLIDDYDDPVRNACGTEDFRKILGFMKVMLGSLLKGNDALDFAVLTGVVRISEESILSGLNNQYVDNIFSVGSDDLFGFTPDEVRTLCADYGHPERFEEARDWYDGYVFGDAEIYNPWSVLNYVDRGFRPEPYWAGTGGDSIISDLMSRSDDVTAMNLRTLATGGSITERVDPTIVYSALHSDLTSIYSIMVMAGYLKAVPNGGLL